MAKLGRGGVQAHGGGGVCCRGDGEGSARCRGRARHIWGHGSKRMCGHVGATGRGNNAGWFLDVGSAAWQEAREEATAVVVQEEQGGTGAMVHLITDRFPIIPIFLFYR